MPSHAIPPLHLYRHLLREATYLPKPCAPYIRQQITTRFHKHKKDNPQTPLTARRLRAAHSHLRSLRAANAGVLANMKHILHLATGRCGRRRRTLMAQNFVLGDKTNDKPQQQSASSAALPASHQQPNKLHRGQPLEPDWLDNWDLPKLITLAASQARQDFYSARPEIKGNRLAPTASDIPAENSLGRPLGAMAARRHLLKWYKRLIYRLVVPLPRQEWEALGRLARGEDRAWDNGPPARRKLCGGITKKSWNWKAYAVEPVRSVERAQSRSQKARTGEQGEGPYGLGRAIGLHRYDRARLWRRLYMQVWQATPTMEMVEGSGKWKIEWGKEEKVVPTATPAQMGFFEGAPEAGRMKGGRSIMAKQLKKQGLHQKETV